MRENFPPQISSDQEQPKTNPDEGIEEQESVIEKAEKLMQKNPDFKKIFEEECLNFLRTKDPEYFYANYSGEVDEKGYLIDRNGNSTSFLPSQNINVGLEEISKIALEKFLQA